MRKLAGTTFGADTSILTKVYTPTVRPTMEYASTTWGTAAKTNKNRLDKVQNMAVRVILGALKTTPVHDTEKTANVAPFETRKNLKILIQGEKLRRLPSHPLQTWHSPPKIASSTKAWTISIKICPGHTKTLWMCQQSCWQILPGSPTETQTYKCFWVSQASP